MTDDTYLCVSFKLKNRLTKGHQTIRHNFKTTING
jgi:hypothetical protein